LPLARELLPHLSLEEAEFVLEAGAGVGALLPELRDRAPDALIVATDLSFGMLNLAARQVPRAVMDASALAFKDESFDAGLLAFVLFHLFEPAQGIEQMARVLRPNGLVGTATWGDEQNPPAYDIWFEELTAHGAPPPDPGFARFELVDTPDKVEAIMTSVGLKPVRSWVGEYRTTSTPDEFLAHRTGHGQSRLRFEAMPEEVRSRCLEKARSRLERLGPEGFEEYAEVVYVVGRKG
jgi:SAM-dependent methyltransferase